MNTIKIMVITVLLMTTQKQKTLFRQYYPSTTSIYVSLKSQTATPYCYYASLFSETLDWNMLILFQHFLSRYSSECFHAYKQKVFVNKLNIYIIWSVLYFPATHQMTIIKESFPVINKNNVRYQPHIKTGPLICFAKTTILYCKW